MNSLVVKIIMGLAGLGIMVFVHELGHFVAAKLAGIDVEVFSLGWGKKLFSFRRKETEYCLSLLPLGGYCKMKGDEAMQDAWESGAKTVAAEQGSFFGASPLRRIIVAAAGPGMNFLFAIAAFTLVGLIGFSFTTFANRIVLEADYAADAESPAREAGLMTGDFITAIEGEPVEIYRDLQEAVAIRPEQPLRVDYTRSGITYTTTVTPLLNKETGAGKIGVYAWVEPVIESVRRDSAAFIAGLREGDRILSVDGKDIPHSQAFYDILQRSPVVSLDLACERDGRIFKSRLVPHTREDGTPDLGITFKSLSHFSQKEGIGEALAAGVAETFDTLALTVKSLGLLFRGIDLSQAVSGPLRITYFVGEVASRGFSKDFSTGLTSILNFLGLLSVALFFMNLLPIPVLDGGLILLFCVEGIRRRAASPRFISRYQHVGLFVIVLLIILSTMSDVFYFFRK
ncbi:MAG: RIP metalloprotease RseP [Spirochaetaceae bacterium]|nr:RIP metalloprotease RseP [Spirochaetaceae bacterium]